ncbi:MAG: DUF1524 domain-containing protein [Alphaproteobacteria bacterium]|nr:DUF1524 domain-containing protein [Alphaproteobacteria bacterium]
MDPTSNCDIGNKTFPEKRPIYHSSPLLITQGIAKFETWGPEQIDERQNDLADIAIKVWNQ